MDPNMEQHFNIDKKYFKSQLKFECFNFASKIYFKSGNPKEILEKSINKS